MIYGIKSAPVKSCGKCGGRQTSHMLTTSNIAYYHIEIETWESNAQSHLGTTTTLLAHFYF